MTAEERIKAKLERGENLTPDEGWVLWYKIAELEARLRTAEMAHRMAEDARLRVKPGAR